MLGVQSLGPIVQRRTAEDALAIASGAREGRGVAAIATVPAAATPAPSARANAERDAWAQ
jgi:hypothetical protein